MGIQFRLGPNDHKQVEDFLSREHAGTDAITLDVKAARHQAAAAAAAVEAGLRVYWEPAAERLADVGFGLDKLPLWTGHPYDIDGLAEDQAARAALVGLTVEKHPALVTHVTAPHFYVTDERTARLNVDLAERTRLAVGEDKPTRAVITVSTTALGRLGIDLAAEYAGAGINDVEIRFSPFGGDDEGIRKIRTAFGVLDQFREHDLSVTLGLSGNIGRAAVAMGHADAYSVGLGMLEKVNHAQTMARFRKEPDPDKKQSGPRWLSYRIVPQQRDRTPRQPLGALSALSVQRDGRDASAAATVARGNGNRPAHRGHRTARTRQRALPQRRCPQTSHAHPAQPDRRDRTRTAAGVLKEARGRGGTTDIQLRSSVADYDVQYDKDSGDWGAKRAGAGKAAGRYDTQAQAHDAARGFAERSGGGEVRDHRKDNNQIRNTDTVGKKDPYPPKG